MLKYIFLFLGINNDFTEKGKGIISIDNTIEIIKNSIRLLWRTGLKICKNRKGIFIFALAVIVFNI